MPRFARTVIAGCPHHVTQRGNNRQAVFFTKDDYLAYLEILRKESAAHALQIAGYCLMPNHIHLIVIPGNEKSLARAIGRTHFRYTQMINRLHGWSGHLWQNRFFSCPLDTLHYWNAMVYVERNPVRAKLVRRPWRWEWSSAACHVGNRKLSKLLDMEKWRKSSAGLDWKQMLTEPQDDSVTENLRRGTKCGRPLGNNKFIKKLETIAGKRLRPLPVGRPRKIQKERGNR